MNQQKQMQLVLLYSLMEMDGGGKKRDVLRHIQSNAYWHKNDENDEMRETRRELKWRNNFAFERLHLAEQGYMVQHSRGNWLVTEKGREFFYTLLGEAKNTPPSVLTCLMPAFMEKVRYLDLDPEETADRILLDSIAEMSGDASDAAIILTEGPLPKGDAVRRFGGRNTYCRNPLVAGRALARAGYHCEINPNHPSFVKRNSSHLYMEPHHLLPLSKTDDFDVSLDREQNIFSLCSNCHRQIHYGTKEDVRRMIDILFKARSEEIYSMLGRRIPVEEVYAMYQAL